MVLTRNWRLAWKPCEEQSAGEKGKGKASNERDARCIGALSSMHHLRYLSHRYRLTLLSDVRRIFIGVPTMAQPWVYQLSIVHAKTAEIYRIASRGELIKRQCAIHRYCTCQNIHAFLLFLVVELFTYRRTRIRSFIMFLSYRKFG